MSMKEQKLVGAASHEVHVLRQLRRVSELSEELKREILLTEETLEEALNFYYAE